MTRFRLLIAAALALPACGSPSAPPEAASLEADAPEPVADVAVRVVRDGAIANTFEGFGSAVAEPGSGRMYTVPFEGVVQSVAVAAGQAVGRGALLVRLAPSAASQADLDVARIDLGAQQAALATTRERYDLHLATRQELESAQALVAAAQARARALGQAGAQRTVTAQAAGVVDTVFVAPGQTVSAGAPLASISGVGGFSVTLGVDAGHAVAVVPGQAVTLSAVDRPEARVTGRVRRVEQALSPTTRLAQVIVAVPGRTPFLLGEVVRGQFDGAEARALVAPRGALLPTPEGLVVFTVRGGRAVRHAATVVAESDSLTGFIASGVQAGDSLVLTNLVQLSDGLRVRVAR